MTMLLILVAVVTVVAMYFGLRKQFREYVQQLNENEDPQTDYKGGESDVVVGMLVAGIGMAPIFFKDELASLSSATSTFVTITQAIGVVAIIGGLVVVAASFYTRR